MKLVEIQHLTSDHFSVTLTFKLRCPTSKISQRYVVDFTKTNWSVLCDYLLDCDITICLNPRDVKLLWWTIKNAILNALPSFSRKLDNNPHGDPSGGYLSCSIPEEILFPPEREHS